MGVMRFHVSAPSSLPADALARVYVTGPDNIPLPSRAHRDVAGIVVERSDGESGQVHVPWPVLGHGVPLLSTSSLMPRERPYQLEVELARGTIGLVRNQLSTWEGAGLVVPDSFPLRLDEAVKQFNRAATGQHDPPAAAEAAGVAIRQGLDLVNELAACYSRQALDIRLRTAPHSPVLLGIDVGPKRLNRRTAARLAEVATAAVVPFTWRQIETSERCRDWAVTDQQVRRCHEQGLRIIGGPLIQLSSLGIPDWTYLFEGHFESLLGLMVEQVEAVVQRYRGKIHLWQVAGRINSADVLGLGEDERLQIAVRLVEAVRRIDPRTPLVMSFDQPWGEYLAGREGELPPFHFADVLVRADLGLAGLGLEINAGYFPDGTQPHHLIDYSRKLDRWSTLGVPLLLSLSAPSAAGPDVLAVGHARPLAGAAPLPLSGQTQHDWVTSAVPLMLAKQCVQVIVWNTLRDAVPHEFPHAGLLDAQSQSKPVWEALRTIRQQFLE